MKYTQQKLDNHASYQEQEDSKDSNENKAQWEDGTIITQLLNIAKTYEIVELEVLNMDVNQIM